MVSYIMLVYSVSNFKLNFSTAGYSWRCSVYAHQGHVKVGMVVTRGFVYCHKMIWTSQQDCWLLPHLLQLVVFIHAIPLSQTKVHPIKFFGVLIILKFYEENFGTSSHLINGNFYHFHIWVAFHSWIYSVTTFCNGANCKVGYFSC